MTRDVCPSLFFPYSFLEKMLSLWPWAWSSVHSLTHSFTRSISRHFLEICYYPVTALGIRAGKIKRRFSSNSASHLSWLLCFAFFDLIFLQQGKNNWLTFFAGSYILKRVLKSFAFSSLGESPSCLRLRKTSDLYLTIDCLALFSSELWRLAKAFQTPKTKT